MKFAQWSLRIAGIYGILALAPQYFLEQKMGVDFPPPLNHPEHFYGFVGVALAWQIAFLIMAKDPARYRLLLIPALLEKFSYGLATLALFAQGRLAALIMVTGLIDLVLGSLFLVAFKLTAAAPETTD
ncbi:MAG: hypothetical protein IV090_23780 [Candidatus Sericytochromatia bacterium]|nr:hypothetical protein [Candidatus Sericytochromatia bacterium]